MFKKIYAKVLTWAAHKYSVYYLAFLSCIESFILPYPPPDILLAPMVLKQPNKAYRFVLICTIASLVGGIIGYILGYFGADLIMPFLEKMDYVEKLEVIKNWFNQYGVFIIFIAGFSPIPYKIFTFGAGIMAMAFIPFVLISFMSRGLRFFLVALIVKQFSNQCDIFLKKYINYLGYGIIVIFLIFLTYKTG